MKIAGRRSDGALYLTMGAGVAVVLWGDCVSPPLDEETVEAMGPWRSDPDDNTFEHRRVVEHLLDGARVVPVVHLGLMTLDEEPKAKDKDKKAVSEIAQTAQAGAAVAPVAPDAVINLPPGKKKKVEVAKVEAVVPGTVALVDNAGRFAQLLASTTAAKHLDAGGEHPFQYCLDHVIPAMEREGKAPDDPNAFCAYWKKEHA